MSPYLFTLVMEYLSRMLAMNSEFWYHPRCKELNLTHLTYANDLLIFCMYKGNAKSALLIKECLEEFSVQSGLHINLAKKPSGLNTQDRSELLSLLNVQEGKLPFKYLVVPLSGRVRTISHLLNCLQRDSSHGRVDFSLTLESRATHRVLVFPCL